MRIPEDIHGRVAVLATADDDGPAAIPVSAVVRVDDQRLIIGLARTRRSLARLRRDPRCALVLIGTGFAATVRGHARVIRDPLEAMDHVAAIVIESTRVADAMNPVTLVHQGIIWGWADADADRRHRAVLTELGALADVLRG